MQQLLEQSEIILSRTSGQFRRYLVDKINWKDRLIGLKGARGTGKTTMLLQWLKDKMLPANKAAYMTLDDLYFSTHSLVATAKQFYKNGGQILVLDEVHKYEGWSREIKNLYDLYPDLQIVFTGSSVIDISRQEADLSRRALMYELHGLSFREYLELAGHAKLEPIKLDQILASTGKIRDLFPPGFRPLEHFQHYLAYGYYPFFIESEPGYHQRLRQLARAIVEFDMAELKGFDIRNAKKMLQLLGVISQNVPFKPNLTKLAEKSGIHRNSVANYLHFLEQARLIWLLHPAGISTATLQKPEKVYLNNPNLFHALGMTAQSISTVREAYFFGQMQVHHEVRAHKVADFEVDRKFVFETGGKGKKKSQIDGLKNAWIVKDDLEFPVGNALPLWLFGFMY